MAPHEGNFFRRWALGASGLAVVIFLMIVSIAVRGCPRPGTPTRPGAMLVPDTGTPPDGGIDGLDFTVDNDRLLHLVWHVRAGDRNSSYVRTEEVWYRRCDLRTNKWSQA